jgi:hypothetical protein
MERHELPLRNGSIQVLSLASTGGNGLATRSSGGGGGGGGGNRRCETCVPRTSSPSRHLATSHCGFEPKISSEAPELDFFFSLCVRWSLLTCVQIRQSHAAPPPPRVASAVVDVFAAAVAQMTSFKRYILSEALVCSWPVLLESVQTIAPLQQVSAFAARLMCCAS